MSGESKLQLTDNIQSNDPKHGSGFTGNLALVAPSIGQLGVLNAKDEDFGVDLGVVDGREPGVLDVGSIVEAQHLRYGIAMPEPRYLKEKRARTIINTGCLFPQNSQERRKKKKFAVRIVAVSHEYIFILCDLNLGTCRFSSLQCSQNSYKKGET